MAAGDSKNRKGGFRALSREGVPHEQSCPSGTSHRYTRITRPNLRLDRMNALSISNPHKTHQRAE